MHILLAQVNTTVGDISGNTIKIKQGIAYAKKLGAKIAVFPELTLSGYPPEDLLLIPHFIDRLESALEEIIKETNGIAVILGTVRRNPSQKGKPLYNSAAIIVDGKLLGFQNKTLLPTYDVFDERRYFEPAYHFSGSRHPIRTPPSCCCSVGRAGVDTMHRGCRRHLLSTDPH